MSLANKLSSIAQALSDALSSQSLHVVVVPPTERREYVIVYAGDVRLDDEHEIAGTYTAVLSIVGYTTDRDQLLSRIEQAVEQVATQLAQQGQSLYLSTLSYAIDVSLSTTSLTTPWYVVDVEVTTLMVAYD